MKVQRPVNGRRMQDEPDLRKHARNAGRGFMNRARDYTLAVHMFVALILIVLAPFTAGAENGRGYLEVSGGYKTGDFGTPIRTNLYYIAPALGYVSTTYDVSVTMPYLFLKNSGNSQTGMMNSTSGMGDIILRGGRVFIPEGDGGFSLDGALAVKLPTADKNKGLGTGEPDYGAFISGHQRFDKTKLSLLTGYIKVGEPSSVTYNDVYLYGIGISQIINSTELYTSFEGRRAMIPGQKNPQEINVGFFCALNTDYAVKGNTFAGLNKGGPDFGLSVGVVRWF
jgi:hypothetical protein